MNIPLDEILAALREGGIDESLNAIRKIAKKRLPISWKGMHTGDFEPDILMAVTWMRSRLAPRSPTRASFQIMPADSCKELLDNVVVEILLPHDPPHREQYPMLGLDYLRESFTKLGLGGEGKYFANCVFSFGYCGLVLASAIERLAPNWDCLFKWGFVGRDLCDIARSSAGIVTQLAESPADIRDFHWGYVVVD